MHPNICLSIIFFQDFNPEVVSHVGECFADSLTFGKPISRELLILMFYSLKKHC